MLYFVKLAPRRSANQQARRRPTGSVSERTGHKPGLHALIRLIADFKRLITAFKRLITAFKRLITA